MSTATRFGRPSSSAIRAAASAPPDGPESKSRAGCSAATSGLHTPPLDCTRNTVGRNPSSPSRERSRSR